MSDTKKAAENAKKAETTGKTATKAAKTVKADGPTKTDAAKTNTSAKTEAQKEAIEPNALAQAVAPVHTSEKTTVVEPEQPKTDDTAKQNAQNAQAAEAAMLAQNPAELPPYNPPSPAKAEIPEVNRENAEATHAVEQAIDGEIVQDLLAKETIESITQEINIEVVNEQPTYAALLDDTARRELIRKEVKGEMEGQLADRSSAAMTISRVKAMVKTRFSALVVQANNTKGTEAAQKAQAALEISAASPLMPSVETYEQIALQEEKNRKDAEKEIEKERQRLEAQVTGKVEKAEQMKVNSAYHFTKKISEADLKAGNIAPEQITGRVISAEGGKVFVSVLYAGAERGQVREVNPSEYDVREVTREQAFELSASAV